MQYSIKIFFWILTNDGNCVHRLDTEVQKGMRTGPWPQGTQHLVGERQISHVNIHMVLCFVQDKHIVELMKVTWDQDCDQLPWVTLPPTPSHGYLITSFFFLCPGAPTCIPSIFWHFFPVLFYFVFNNSSTFSSFSKIKNHACIMRSLWE